MTITDADMRVYDFGEKKVWPVPDLSTSYVVLDHYNDLMGRLKGLEQLVHVSAGRQDHLVKSLDVTASALREALFRVMVLREALTGFANKEQEDA